MLTVEDGIILCGEAIVIPPEERKKVLEQLHQGHLGISKYQRRAEQCVYWPGIRHHMSHEILPYLPEEQIPGMKATTEVNTTT